MHTNTITMFSGGDLSANGSKRPQQVGLKQMADIFTFPTNEGEKKIERKIISRMCIKKKRRHR